MQGRLDTKPSTQPVDLDKLARQKKLEARMIMIEAATQPVSR